MANCIAGYKGGIHYLIEAAVRCDGALFKRYQSRGRYGYQWSAWKPTGDRFDTGSLPLSMEAGFSTIYKLPYAPKWRLPKS